MQQQKQIEKPKEKPKFRVRVYKKYRTLVPPPSKEDYKTLKNSIAEDGQHTPIIVNQNGVILDGHTRFDICNELGIKPKYEIEIFDNEYDEKRFVIIVNLARRHLTLFQKAELLFDWWKKERYKGFQSRGQHGKLRRLGIKYKTKERLQIRLAKILGCAHTTVYKMMYVLKNGDEKTIRMVRKGTMTVNAAYVSIFKPVRKKYDWQAYKHFPICLNCGDRTEESSKISCHVHTQVCCTKCGWGV